MDPNVHTGYGGINRPCVKEKGFGHILIPELHTNVYP